MSSRPPQAPVPKTKFIQDLSGGINLSTAREAIKDNEAWWLEGAIPIAPGNLTITNGPSENDPFGHWHTAINGESGTPTFVYPFNASGTDYLFVVYSNSGNGYVGDISGVTVTKIFAAVLTSGRTAAAQWNNQGILILDPTGYWDWNVTTAAVLTALSQSVQSVTIRDGGVYTTFPGSVTFGGPGSGASAAPYQGVGSAIPLTPGSGYKVNDVLTFNYTFGFLNAASAIQLTVTTVNATGGVTGLQVTFPGIGLNVGGACPNTTTLNGGAGTGASATIAWTLTAVPVSVGGNGYSTAPPVTLVGGVATRAAAVVANVSGFLGGAAIATYAGRAWFANGRTITFTDANSYNSFVGSGSSFTVQDDYLHDSITALYAANNYLYIFGVDSTDVLSNVTITSAGTASFSRVNISASIGTNQPQSIFSYYRAVAFANPGGFYLLSGASPEKISDALDLLIPQIDYSNFNNVSGAIGSIAGELVAFWSFKFTDTFMGGGANTPLMAIYFKGRWWLCRQALFGSIQTFGPVVSLPVDTPPAGTLETFQLYGISATKRIYQLFQDPGQTFWRVLTKLHDLGKPMTTKSALRTAMGVQMGGFVATRAGLTLSVDDENTAPGQATTLVSGTFTGYKYFTGTDNQGGGQFMGMQATGVAVTQADITRIQWLAFQYSEMTEWPA